MVSELELDKVVVSKDILLPMDILVYTPTEIAKDKYQKFTFIHDVFKLGKILYANK